MQVLCKMSNSASDVLCPVCGQGFQVYWSRTSRAEQAETRTVIQQELAAQHTTSKTQHVHPRTGFNLPKWSGLPAFSGAALLGGAADWAI